MFENPRILAFGVSVFLILISGGHVVISHCGPNFIWIYWLMMLNTWPCSYCPFIDNPLWSVSSNLLFLKLSCLTLSCRSPLCIWCKTFSRYVCQAVVYIFIFLTVSFHHWRFLKFDNIYCISLFFYS